MRRAVLFLVAAVAWTPPRAARADSIDACASAATRGQRLQQDGKVVEARASFLVCVAPQCPAEVKAVCNRLLSETEASEPTIILGARDARGQDLSDVRVLVDGSPFADALDGRPRAMDPGPHVLRFVLPSGRTVEQDLVVREAEKNREVVVAFPPDRPSTAAQAPAAVASSTSRTWAYVLGGVGVVALGAFAALAVHGQNEYDGCRSGGCSSSQVSGLGLQRGFAFGTLGLGIVALGAATWLFVAPGPEPAVTVSGRF